MNDTSGQNILSSNLVVPSNQPLTSKIPPNIAIPLGLTKPGSINNSASGRTGSLEKFDDSDLPIEKNSDEKNSGEKSSGSEKAPKEPLTGFSGIGVTDILCAALKKQGIESPTAIQLKAIPVAIEGRDIVGVAQTGTGKTLAFILPIIQKLQVEKGQALIVVPTRELALQVDQAIASVSGTLKPRLATAVLIGGASMQMQLDRLARKPRIIIATPGRLQDHLNQRTFSLNQICVVVLDEADRMFDMGFAPQIQKFFELIPSNRQVKLFSATMPPEIAVLANQHLKNPVRIEITPPGTSVVAITQEICFVSSDKKGDVLAKVLEDSEGLAIVFCRTKHGAKDLTRRIKNMGYPSAEIHSNRSLAQRRQALEGFRSGKYKILVATDIAARGIDVNNLQLVVNFDLPAAAEDYVHRIGRTGRAGRAGHAISFATNDQLRDVKQIERLTGAPLELSKHSMERPADRRFSEGGSSNNRRQGGNSRYGDRRRSGGSGSGSSRSSNGYSSRGDSSRGSAAGSSRSENSSGNSFRSNRNGPTRERSSTQPESERRTGSRRPFVENSRSEGFSPRPRSSSSDFSDDQRGNRGGQRETYGRNDNRDVNFRSPRGNGENRGEGPNSQPAFGSTQSSFSKAEGANRRERPRSESYAFPRGRSANGSSEGRRGSTSNRGSFSNTSGRRARSNPR